VSVAFLTPAERDPSTGEPRERIQSLPADAQRTLIERIVRELGATPSEPARRARPPDDPFLGLLADEIHRIATKARHEGREVFNGDENAS